MSETRIIKRYANRKLYDTRDSRYVTLDQIAGMIRDSEDVRIVDNTSKEDITSVTLAQIMLEEEKKQNSFLSLQAMRNIIQSGGERIEELVSQAQKRVSGVFTRKPAGESGQLAAGLGGTAVEDESEAERHKALREIREWIQSSQRFIDEWQKRIDDRIRHVVAGISPFSSLQKEVGALAERMGELEKRLELLTEGHPPAEQASDQESDKVDC